MLAELHPPLTSLLEKRKVSKRKPKRGLVDPNDRLTQENNAG